MNMITNSVVRKVATSRGEDTLPPPTTGRSRIRRIRARIDARRVSVPRAIDSARPQWRSNAIGNALFRNFPDEFTKAHAVIWTNRLATACRPSYFCIVTGKYRNDKTNSAPGASHAQNPATVAPKRRPIVHELTHALLDRDFVRRLRGTIPPDPVLGACAPWVGDHAWVNRYERGDVIIGAHLPNSVTPLYRIEFGRDTPVSVITAALDAITEHATTHLLPQITPNH